MAGALAAALLFAPGCHLIYPFEGLVLDAGGRDVAATDVATTDVATTDVATTDVATTDVATMPGICPFVADNNTKGMFDFVVQSGTKIFPNLVGGGPPGSLVNNTGQIQYTPTPVAGPLNCGGGGLEIPSPPHVGNCTFCGQSASLPCSKAGYAVIPNWGGTALPKGSIDLWVKFNGPANDDQAIVSRDATGINEPGHITIYRHPNGFIAVRLQKVGVANELVCSKPVLDNTWRHVGVNFGPPGPELYVHGQRVAEKKTVNGDTCGDGKAFDSGLDQNNEPWVVGGGAWLSCKGVAAPVTHMLDGSVANFRISSVRRDFSTMFKSP